MNALAPGICTGSMLNLGSTLATKQVCIKEYVDACQRSCVLLQLQVYSPGRSRSNLKEADAASRTAGTVNGVCPVRIMPSNLSRSIGAVVKRTRRFLESHSCPFGDYRQVLIGEYTQIRERLLQFEQEYQELVKEAASDWDESMLPESKEDYLAHCRFELAILPMPEFSAHISLPNELEAEVKTQMRASVHQQYQGAREALIDECAESLQLAVERVVSERRTTSATFRAASEAAGRICRFNVSNDQRLEAMAVAVRALVHNTDPKQCNTSEIYKLEVVSDINNLLLQVINRTTPAESD